MRTETLNFSTANGDTSAYVVFPAEETKKAVFVIQEWWGVNDHIKDIAGRWAAEGYIAIAPDLYRGKIATNAEDASKMMHALEISDGIDTIHNAVKATKEAYGVEKFAITGYCMGGTFALRSACDLTDFVAAAPFYGDVPEEDVLKKISIPVVFTSGIHDKWINAEVVGRLEAATEKFNLPVESDKYDADHAFFNNTRPEVYSEINAKAAWKKVTAFFKERFA